jgi:hypothetical protein
MAFTLQTWGRVSTTANEPAQILADTSLAGTVRDYTYFTNDSQATVSALNTYFALVAYDLVVGDLIEVYSSTDLTRVNYLVTAITTNPNTVTLGIQTSLTRISGVLTQAQVTGLFAASVAAIPALGAHRVILVQDMTIEIVFGTASFAAGGAFGLQYTAAAGAAGTPATATVAAASINGVAATSSLVTVAGLLGITVAANVVNQGIFFTNATQAFTNAGAGALINYKIDYSVMTTTS